MVVFQRLVQDGGHPLVFSVEPFCNSLAFFALDGELRPAVLQNHEIHFAPVRVAQLAQFPGNVGATAAIG